MVDRKNLPNFFGKGFKPLRAGLLTKHRDVQEGVLP